MPTKQSPSLTRRLLRCALNDTVTKFSILVCLSGWMTLGTVLEVGDVGFDVHARHLGWRMIVAAVAGERRVVDGMTDRARGILAFGPVIEREWMLDESRRRPTVGRMARRAISAKLSAMHRRVGVA